MLTDAQLLARLQKAEGLLKQTEHGYTPDAYRWRSAMQLIDEVQEELRPEPEPPVPALGPIISGGRSILLESPTHNTDGFTGYWPAFDTAFGRAGASIVAPEGCKVIDHTGSAGGVGFKVRGRSTIVYLVLHAATRPNLGVTFVKGQKMSSVGRILASQGGPHCHLGLDTRPLIGKWLKWGRDGNGPDYSWGSPTIGKQLTEAIL